MIPDLDWFQSSGGGRWHVVVDKKVASTGAAIRRTLCDHVLAADEKRTLRGAKAFENFGKCCSMCGAAVIGRWGVIP